MNDSNYWHDSRVRVRAPMSESWKLDEKRMLAAIEVPEYCAVHGEGEHDEHPECLVCCRVAEYEHAYETAPLVGGRREIELPEGHDQFIVPFTWVVCTTCRGKGSHVNPSIDCDGLTREDFDEDPDFAESYHSGVYDVTCSTCGGRRVMPKLTPRTPEEKSVVKALRAVEAEERELDAAIRAERALGC